MPLIRHLLSLTLHVLFKNCFLLCLCSLRKNQEKHIAYKTCRKLPTHPTQHYLKNQVLRQISVATWIMVLPLGSCSWLFKSSLWFLIELSLLFFWSFDSFCFKLTRSFPCASHCSFLLSKSALRDLWSDKTVWKKGWKTLKMFKKS